VRLADPFHMIIHVVGSLCNINCRAPANSNTGLTKRPPEGGL
jgi:hypothetical protein